MAGDNQHLLDSASITFAMSGAADDIARAVRRHDRAHLQGLRALVAAPAAGRRRQDAERGDHPLRRHRVRSPRLLRLDDRDAEHRRDGGRRAALQQLPHHRDLLADARLFADRAEPPLGRAEHDRQLRQRLPEHAGRADEACDDARRDPARAGLWHLLRRQVAPRAVGADLGSRSGRRLAAAARVRSVLRVPRRGDAPVLPRADVRQPSRRAAGASRGRLPRQRRSGRSLDRLRP